MAARDGFGGPRVVAIGAVAILGIAGAVISTRDPGEHEFRALLRVTAMTSTLLFLPIFTAAARQLRWPSATGRWVLANRRYLGLTFATSHAVHTYAIVSLIRLVPQGAAAINPLTRLFGGAGLVLIAAMAATSNDASQRALGPWWGRLHRVGLWVVWLDFAFTYSNAAAVSPFHALLTVLFLAAAAFRLWPMPVRAT